ncbi:MAG: ectonucleotide pyrophosphatase/phosphodiesterase, partial [Oscillospiraceae bacterium]
MNKLFVLSVDALQTGDIPYLLELPNFSKILKRGAVVKNIREVYPTLTNVNHVSIITGTTPDTHGVYHNMLPFAPVGDVGWNMIGKNWFWQSKYIKAPTIVDAAKAKGLSTACVAWPSMGGDVPDYNLAEMWPKTRPTVRETYEISCTANVMELYFDRYIAPFNFDQAADIDTFSVPIAADIIRRFQPDLMLEHIIYLDYSRHKFGNNHPKAKEALAKIDGYLGDLLAACT